YAEGANNEVANGGRRPAGIGDDQQLDARPVLQEFGGQMREPADARDSTRYFVWTPFRSGNEIGEVFDAERGSDYNEHGIFGREPDRGKVTRQLDWQIGRCTWQRHEGRQDWHIKHVSIGRSVGCNSRSDAAGSTGMIDCQDLLAP